jgi:hypothetical protein
MALTTNRARPAERRGKATTSSGRSVKIIRYFQGQPEIAKVKSGGIVAILGAGAWRGDVVELQHAQPTSEILVDATNWDHSRTPEFCRDHRAGRY